MKRASEIAAMCPQLSESGEPTQPHLAKTAARFWTVMAEMYGHKWLTTAGETPTQMWLLALSELSGEQIKAGLRACLNNGEPWPPSAPQFKALCRPPRRENAAAYRWQPQLPAPVSRPEKARAELAKIRATLRGAA